MDPIEYNGARDVNSLQEAVKQATRYLISPYYWNRNSYNPFSLPFFEPILPKDVSAKQKESEVTYFLMYDPLTMNKDVLVYHNTLEI